MTSQNLQTIIDTKQKILNQNKDTYLENQKTITNYLRVEEHLKLQMTNKIDKVKEQIEPLVNSSLKSIFEDPLTFEITTDIFRGKISYSVNIFDHKQKIKGQIESFGGGVSAIVSVILRLLFIILSDKPRILVLDETINQVSPRYRPKTAQFLQKICLELGFQITVITFDENHLFGEFADTIYKASLNSKGNSIYKRKEV